jgi:Zn-finger nucleic acid-binding protein
MKCPIDGADLVMSERQGVEIDYCPSCRGVWLDRGELDKILDRAAELASPAAAAQPAPPAQPYPTAPYPTAPYPTDPYPPADYGRPYGEGYRDDRGDRDRQRGDDDPRRDPRNQPYRKKKKESWLGDILDFG